MSYILDALKKSEQQRQALASEAPPADAVPLYETAGTAGPSSLLVGLILGTVASLLVAAALWFVVAGTEPVDEGIGVADDVTSTHLASSESGVNDAGVNDPGVKQNADRAVSHTAVVAVREVQTIAPASTSSTVTLSSPSSEAAKTAAESSASPHDVTEARDLSQLTSDSLATASSPATTSSPVVGASTGQVETARRVLPPLSVLKTIPDLIITGHIYSSVATKRSVSMNGRDWSEGDYVSDSIRINTITPDGVIIEVDGWNLPLKRNKGWQAIAD